MRLLRHGVAGLSHVGQLPELGQPPDFRLRQSAFGQRATDLAFPHGLQARTVFSVVVAIAAVGHHGHVQPPGELLDLCEQLGLAVIAAVGLIGLIGGIGQFAGLDHLVANADLPGKRACLVQLADGQARADARHGHRAVAQGQLGRFGQHGAVQAAGERHRTATEAAKQFEKPITLVDKFRGPTPTWQQITEGRQKRTPYVNKKVLRRNAVAMLF